MTYMPKFIQAPSASAGEELLINQEAHLLRLLSKERLSAFLATDNTAATSSVYEYRLESELLIIESKDYSPYFLIVADYVQWAKDNNIPVGPGRGAGPCSLVGFVLGITKIDPIRYDLPFERFLNPDRKVLTDFDIEFCDIRRDEVTDYILTKYGSDKVAQVSSEQTRPLPSRLVICDRPLENLVPLYPNPHSGFPTAKIELKQLANAGFVQFNAINQRALTIIQRTVETIAASGISIDIDTIPMDDEETYRLLCNGEKSNIDILDGDNYSNTLLAVRPKRFEDLYAVLALCQPNQHQYISEFVERKENAGLFTHSHPALESITSHTYGHILYQEQVMHLANKLAGLTYAEADRFQRALRRPNAQDKESQKTLFVNGAMKNDISQPLAAALFEKIAKTNPHSYNKSHVIAFATIAYQSAWLNAHFPTEYASAKASL